ncbi:hypothetical protein [Micromonospora sp. 4G55]|uniref:hypothetical protein n=1 Tax=Micromonospora sp. 4G55 TaxID=2806102 RepID=UPI001EE3B092|nr:hypothetical protein [Micromonospora sp. 4G55]
MEKTVHSFPLHPECPDLRRLADNPAEALLRAEATSSPPRAPPRPTATAGWRTWRRPSRTGGG